MATRYDDASILKGFRRKIRGKRFAANFFPYFWNEESSTETTDDVADLVEKVSEAVCYLNCFVRDVHLAALHAYFTKNRLCKKTLFRFYRNFCRNMLRDGKSIFLVILESLCLADRMVKFAKDRQRRRIRSFSSFWWEYVFNKFFMTQFYDSRAWNGLLEYLSQEFYPSHDVQGAEACGAYWGVSLRALYFCPSELERTSNVDFSSSDESIDQETVCEQRNGTGDNRSNRRNCA